MYLCYINNILFIFIIYTFILPEILHCIILLPLVIPVVGKTTESPILVPLGTKDSWKLKGVLDVAYEYELADLNEREHAKLVNLETDYHKLAKPADDKGQLRTKASIGVEIEDRYGVFLTGEYKLGEHDQDEYRAGVTLKAVF